MKIKQDYMLRHVADHHIVIPTGQEAVHFNGIITLNNSGKLLFETLMNGAEKADLITCLTDAYDVDAEQAEADVDTFLETLRSKNVLE